MASTTTPLNPNLESILRENRVFPPPPEFAAKAHIKSLEEYEALYKQSVEDPEAFWGGVAEELHWFVPWTKVLEWDLPWAKWFVGGKINLCYNCVDRHALGDKAGKVAILWEGEPGEVRKITFARTARRGAEVRECPQRPRHKKGRPRRHLHGDDPGAGDRAARLRAHWRGAFGDLRRIRRQRARRPHQ